MNEIVKMELDNFVQKNNFVGKIDRSELETVVMTRTLKTVETIRDLMMIWMILTVIGIAIFIVYSVIAGHAAAESIKNVSSSIY